MGPLPVTFEDDQFMVVDKPAGLVVEPSETQRGDTLSDILRRDRGITLERGGIVHRLDKDTSGLLLVAKTQDVLEALQLQFKKRMVKKEYLALVHGLVIKQLRVEGSILRNPKSREKFMVSEEGREAATGFVPEKRYRLSEEMEMKILSGLNRNQERRLKKSGYGNFTLLRCFPETGRTHQIRVHLKYISHPIVGDEKYAGRKTVRLDRQFCPRQFLHAARLQIYHPGSGERMEFESGLPEDLKQALSALSPLDN